MNRSAASRRPSLRPVARLALLIVLLLVVAGCDEAPPTFQVREPALQVRTINGHAVPAFPTPEEQLAYTRSSFADLNEKRAALEAVALLFPDAEEPGGEAALELAYLRLGPDYAWELLRLATRPRDLAWYGLALLVAAWAGLSARRRPVP